MGIRNDGHDNDAHSDEISISSGDGNRIEDCLVYSNSDDGTHTWRSVNAYIGHTAVGHNGDGDGEGVGIRAGGKVPAARALVERCLSYDNFGVGSSFDLGANVTFRNNTAGSNAFGFHFGSSTVVTDNISTDIVEGVGSPTHNSWPRMGK